MIITLPRKFDNFVFERIGKPEEIKHLIGIPCISYSQNSSLDYNIHSFIKSYLFGEKSDSIWMNFGSEIGQVFETYGLGDYTKFKLVTPELIESIRPYLFDDTYTYEKPVYCVINLNGQQILFYGFIDVYRHDKIIDIKTGSKINLQAYNKPTYMQTKLYAYCLEEMTGEVPEFIGVLGLLRKGKGNRQYPFKIEGSTLFENGYTRESVEQYIENTMKPNIMKISGLYNDYNKMKDANSI